MVAPASLKNNATQSVPTLYGADGVGRYPLGVGDVNAGFDGHAGWTGVASHAAGDTFGASDGIVVVGGTYSGNAKPFATDSLGRLAVIFAPAVGALVDGSGSIGAGGTAQDALALNASRVYLLVQNIDDSEDLWVNLGVNAVVDQPSIRLGPGGSLIMESNFVGSGRVSVVAATTGHKFVCKEA